MRCPKCNSRLREVDGFSQLSGLSRDSIKSATAISGLSCWCCGYWRCADVVPVVREADAVPTPAPDPAIKVAVHFIVVKFFDSIVAQRKAGASWYAISVLLTKGGNRCQEKSLRKYFELEEAKRFQNNEAQAQA